MILDDILAQTRIDLETSKKDQPLDVLVQRAAARAPARSLARALRRPGAIACIAEFKRRSPSAGWIAQHANAREVAPAYASGGAAALSVLTNAPFFGGSVADLVVARTACDLPILRKDFIVDRYQLVEARAFGADAVLLIVAALPDEELRSLLAAVKELGLEALVEAHDAGEVARAVAAGAQIIGINNRDLRTFTVDRELAARLRSTVPADRIIVAESGIRDAADVARLRAAGVDAILVGETLMRAPDPAAALRELLG
jgi:indole-3-glycerol phosphate synthase